MMVIRNGTNPQFKNTYLRLTVLLVRIITEIQNKIEAKITGIQADKTVAACIPEVWSLTHLKEDKLLNQSSSGD